MKVLLFTFILSSFIAGYSDRNIPVFVFSSVICVLFSLNFKKTLRYNCLRAVLCVLVFIFGIFLNYYSEKKISDSADIFIKNNNGTITATVISEANEFYFGSNFYVKSDSKDIIRVTYNSKKEICVGDRVEIRNFSPVMIFPENKISDSRKSMIGKNCVLSAEVSSENLTVTGVSKLYVPLNIAYKLKQNTFYKLLKYMKYDEAALAQAIFTSDKKPLTDEIYNMLIKTGTIHLATVSGFHFNLLGALILFIMKLFCGSHRKRIAAVSLIMTLFAFYTGLSVPVLRALITFLVLCMSDFFGVRHSDKKIVFLIIIAGFIINSPLIVFDISFILMLVSNASLIFFSIPEEKLYLTSKRFHLPVNSLIVNLIMMPFIFSMFGRISTVSVLANYCVDFIMGPILLLTGFTAIFSVVFSPFASIAAVFLKIALKYFLFILKVFSVPNNINPHFAFSMLTAIFTVMFAITFVYLFIRKKKNYKKNTVLSLYIFALLCYSCIIPYLSDTIYITLCGNLSQGLVLSKNSHHAVIASAEELYYSGSSADLRQNEIIDLWIVSKKFDSDLVEKLAEMYTIKRMAVPEKLFDSEYKGSLEAELIKESAEFDFRGVKIYVSAKYENISYSMAEYKGEKIYFSDMLEFFAYNIEELDNAQVVFYKENKKGIETLSPYVKIPESVNFYMLGESFSKNSLGILKNGEFAFE